MNKIFATMMLLLLNLNIYAADLTKNEATHLVLSHLPLIPLHVRCTFSMRLKRRALQLNC